MLTITNVVTFNVTVSIEIAISAYMGITIYAVVAFLPKLKKILDR